MVKYMKYKASFYGVPCFFENENNKLYGRNIFFEFVLTEIVIPIHLFFTFICSWVFNFELLFPIKIEEETGS